MKKTAREMFEEAGWTYYENTFSFYYIKEDWEDFDEEDCEDGDEFPSITFYYNDRTFIIDDDIGNTTDMETLKLINYQCKELGWL